MVASHLRMLGPRMELSVGFVLVCDADQTGGIRKETFRGEKKKREL